MKEKGAWRRDLELPHETWMDPLGQNLVTWPHLSAREAETSGPGATERLKGEHPTTTEPEKRKKRRGEDGSQAVCYGRTNEEKHELSKYHASCIVLDIYIYIFNIFRY